MNESIDLLPASRALVERLYESLAAGDRDAIAELLTDDFVGHLTPGLPYGIGGEHRGPQAMIRDGWFAIGRHWRARAHPESFELTSDGRMCVRGHYRGRARQSGTEFTAEFVHLLEFRDGRIAGLVQTTDSAAFVAALGADSPLTAIDLTVEEGLAVLRLNRPEVRNAINQTLADDFLIAARRIATNPAVRAVLICGSGRDLTVGGDLGFISSNAGDDLGALIRSMTTPFHLAFEVLAGLEVPIVTAARGAIAGGGLGFVYAADIVIAADDTRFVPAFGALGLSGDGGGTWHLPRRIGPARAAAAYLLGTPITAEQAYAWGLASEVWPSEEVDARALAVARQLAAGPTQALGAMRRLLRESWDRSLPDQLHSELYALQTSARTQDASNAISSFLNNQTPTFSGE